jgi:nicotinamidase-related amidase
MNTPMDPNVAPEYGRAALITIDVQRDTLDGASLEIPGTSAALPIMSRLTRHFRRRSKPVIHVVRLYLADGSNADLCRRQAIEQGAEILRVGSEGCQVAKPLLPEPNIKVDAPTLLGGQMQPLGPSEWLMYKPRWGAFYQTPLERHLRELDVTTLVFVGCNFPNCPRTSIFEASERDFRVVAISDGISGFDRRASDDLLGIGVSVQDAGAYLDNAV